MIESSGKVAGAGDRWQNRLSLPSQLRRMGLVLGAQMDGHELSKDARELWKTIGFEGVAHCEVMSLGGSSSQRFG